MLSDDQLLISVMRLSKLLLRKTDTPTPDFSDRTELKDI